MEELAQRREERRIAEEHKAAEKAALPKKIRPKKVEWEVEEIRGMEKSKLFPDMVF